MADLIDRQAAIETALEYFVEFQGGAFHEDDQRVLKSRLEELPSAQKTGRWESYIISLLDGEGCRCSECGFEGVPYWDFCPGCGAKMGGESDEKGSAD